jgi:hypothetical protein
VARARRDYKRLRDAGTVDLEREALALDELNRVLVDWRWRLATLPASGSLRMDPSYAAELALDLLDSDVQHASGVDLLSALSRCLNHDLVPPKALSDELARRMGLLLTGRAANWADVFGRVFPEGIKPASVRAERFTAPMVYRTARALLAKNPHRPIDKEFWEDGVGKACNMSASGAQGLVKLHIEQSGAPPLKRLKELLQRPMSEHEAMYAALWEAVNTEPDT